MADDKLLDIRGLYTQYNTDEDTVYSVNDLSLSLGRGRTLGLVGETGAGKTTTCLSILRLLPSKIGEITKGEIIFDGKNLLELPEEEMRHIRGNDIAMIFQDPLSSLNPVFTVGDQIGEALKYHGKNKNAKDIEARVEEMLELVGLPKERKDDYPHQFSGGMKQRVVIAMALACEPKLLLADEPTTAFDVTLQAQIMDLIQQLKEEENMGVILITHDMAVVAENCDRVIVMYLGQMVEEASVTDIFEHPLHPYTIGLIQSIPQMTTDSEQELFMIKGSLPLLTQIKKGCRFASRCPYATDKCREEEPELQKTGENHSVRCHFPRFGE